jgi:cysteinyl-tRNA synthetase
VIYLDPERRDSSRHKLEGGPIKKFLWILAFLVVTNGATYWFVRQQYQSEMDRYDRALRASGERLRKVQGQLQRLEAEAERLRVWSTFIDLQHHLRQIDQAVDELNFGQAIDRVGQLRDALQEGKLGDQLSGAKEELLGHLDAAERELKRKNERARIDLAKLNQRAFELLSGIKVGEAEAPPESAQEAEPKTMPSPSPTPEESPAEDEAGV